MKGQHFRNPRACVRERQAERFDFGGGSLGGVDKGLAFVPGQIFGITVLIVKYKLVAFLL